jgi:hypothetical protein
MSKFIPGITQLLGGTGDEAENSVAKNSIVNNTIYRIEQAPHEGGIRDARLYLSAMVLRDLVNSFNVSYVEEDNSAILCIEWPDLTSSNRRIFCG